MMHNNSVPPRGETKHYTQTYHQFVAQFSVNTPSKALHLCHFWHIFHLQHSRLLINKLREHVKSGELRLYSYQQQGKAIMQILLFVKCLWFEKALIVFKLIH